MRIREYVKPELVMLDLHASGVADALERMTEHLARTEGLPPTPELHAALLAREHAHTTALDRGVAVPHATVPGLPAPLLLIAVAPDGVAFGPPDAPPVRLFFLLLSPPDQCGLHIKLLARIARLVRRNRFVDDLTGAATPAALVDVINHAEPQQA